MSDYEYGMAQNWIEQFREQYRVRGYDDGETLANNYVCCFTWANTPQNHNVWVRRMLERHPERNEMYTCYVNGEPQI